MRAIGADCQNCTEWVYDLADAITRMQDSIRQKCHRKIGQASMESESFSLCKMHFFELKSSDSPQNFGPD